ncbi:RES family NAD+ phosphorylase [Clostridium butyricum]|uniref:RES family NAD+ phosphorylase n=1 Tax=Clostridium butyricum TaxID=1492 RepID=UPI00374FAF7D
MYKEVFGYLDEVSLIDTFCNIFYNEIDSWFSADIVCCDECREEFIRRWPGVYSRDLDFQRNEIDMDSFYSGSRINLFFSKEEYDELIENIKCPRCGSPIQSRLYPYNFPFDVDDIDDELDELSELAEKTPSLLLANPLAKKIFDFINNKSKATKKIAIDKKYYRGRKFKSEKKSYGKLDFTCPPKGKVTEGRYNHSGFPAIYLGDSPGTCFIELRKPNDGIMVAEIIISKRIKILDLIDIEDEYDEDSALRGVIWSSLMASPDEGEGWYKPQYIFTRFIADCASYAGFDAIIYPSVRGSDSRHNIVILDGIKNEENLLIGNIKKITNEDFCKEEDIFRKNYFL